MRLPLHVDLASGPEERAGGDPDQISQATINPRPPCPITRFPTPEHFETSAMPTQDGLRLNHLHRTKKARPKPRHPYEQRAITAKQSETRGCPRKAMVS